MQLAMTPAQLGCSSFAGNRAQLKAASRQAVLLHHRSRVMAPCQATLATPPSAGEQS